MKLKWIVLLSGAVSALSGAVLADSFTPEEAAGFLLPNFTFGVVPVAGVYYDPTQSGTGLTSDTVRSGNSTLFFATYYHYTANGEPTWMNFLGPIANASLTSYAENGVPATVTGEYQRATGGQCFDCAFTPVAGVAMPYGSRTFHLLDGRWVQLPASGNAAARDMHLARSFTSQVALNSALLESGALWQCKQRHFWYGVENGSGSSSDSNRTSCGWLRFERRAPTMNWRYVAPLSTTWIQDGQGGHLASIQPNWLIVPDLNNIATQYQLESVLSNASTVGSSINFTGTDMEVEYAGSQSSWASTIVLHPTTGNIHAISHCIGCTSGASFQRDNAGMTAAGQFVWAGVDADGQERLILRVWSRYLNGWRGEIELTRVPEGLRKQVLPNYVPSADPR